MKYGPDDINVLTLTESIQKRPGMYLGDVTSLGTARLIGLATDVLIALVVNRDARLSFTHHAFLDVSTHNRDVTVSIHYHPDECPDILDRCTSLVHDLEKLQPDEYALEQGPNAVAPMPILNSLASDLSILRSTKDRVTAIIGPDQFDAAEQTISLKGAKIEARFHISEMMETNKLTQEYLEGFLEGRSRIPGLIVRSVEVK